MNKLFKISFIAILFLASCSKSDSKDSSIDNEGGIVPVIPTSVMIDSNTPTDVLPDNTNIGQDWKLDFSDEFAGNTINNSRWRIDESQKSRAARSKLGINQWFWKKDNVSVEHGYLVLKVSKPASGTMYCGSINSSGKYTRKYGYFEAKISIANTNMGTHTAFWLQSPTMGNVDGTANDGAEIDIFESAWANDYTQMNLHYDGYGKNHKSVARGFNTPGIHNGYHTWGLLWTEKYIKVYYDGIYKAQYSKSILIPHAEEYVWLSDGAAFIESGSKYFTDRPLGTLTNAYVDYVRVWKYTGNDLPN